MLNQTCMDYLANVVKELRQDALVFCAGVYEGEDVACMAASRPDLRFFVVDSFAGLAPPNKEDRCEDVAKAGECNPHGMQSFLDNTKDANVVAVVKAWIDRELSGLVCEAIWQADMVWLDLDHYAPTKAILDETIPTWLSEFNSPPEEQIVLTHDYGFKRTPGIKKACDEFGKWTVEVETIARWRGWR